MNVEQLIEDGKEKHGFYAVNSSRAFEAGVRHALAAMFPTRYTPREEVTEGWYFANQVCGSTNEGRDAVRVMRSTGKTTVHVTNCDIPFPLEWFDDFLRVPAWLVEGLNDSESPKGSKL